MMGLLVQNLQNKFELSDAFAMTLSDFCKRRNKLVHNMNTEMISSQTDWEELVRTHVFVSDLRITAKSLIDLLCNIEISIASNYQSPLRKDEIEAMFKIDQSAENQYVEEMRALLESGAFKGIYERIVLNEIAKNSTPKSKSILQWIKELLQEHFR